MHVYIDELVEHHRCFVRLLACFHGLYRVKDRQQWIRGV